MLHQFKSALWAGLLMAAAVTASASDEIPLTVKTADGSSTNYTLDSLDTLPQQAYETQTIWTDGVIEFSGVLLADLLEDAGAKMGIVTLTALNDYTVEIPVEDIQDGFPLVATRMDGDTMPVRDKGPFWLVYPYDQGLQFQTESVYTRSIWQLVAISVAE